MSFQSIIGQPLAVDLAAQWLARKTNQPLLFYGPEGVGKRTFALEMAKALNCMTELANGRSGEAAPAQDASPARRPAGSPIRSSCDTCLSCRKIAGGTHPDVRVADLTLQAAIREEALEKQQNLRIETILKERHRLLQSAVEGRWKVLILDEAHRLTPDAANVLLKILEEPPAQTAIFLLTPYRDRLFATLLSRCQPVRFRPLSDEEMLECLKRLGSSATRQGARPPDRVAGDPSRDPIALVELAQGSPGRALHMSREEQIQAVREAEALWQSLSKEPAGAIVSHAESRAKVSRPTRADMEQRIQGLLIPAARALRAGDRRAAKPVWLIQEALTQLRQNVSPALVYDYLLLQLARTRR